MNQFHPNEQNNPVALDGKADKIVLKRSAIKLSDGPKVMVAIPIGGKPVSTHFVCPVCKDAEGKPIKYDINEGYRPGGLVPMEFLLQHMNWLPPLNVTMGMMYKTGTLSAEARQIMTQECKRIPSTKYIFYVDDDMIIPQMGLYMLYNFMEKHQEAGAITGVYTTRQKPAEPLIYTEHGMGAAWDFEMGEGAHPTKIIGAGAGCLLARVEAIKDWEQANPDTAIWCDSSEFPASNGGRVTWGHDFRFVRNLVEAGWPCYVDGRVLCGHFDIKTGQVYEVPADAPGFKKRKVNTEMYWDTVYAREGFDSWRKYEKMFTAVEREVGANVFEIGCGPGILGQRLTAKMGVHWVGMDMSEVAVAQAQARFLNAFQQDARTLTLNDLHDLAQGDTVVATEFLEHLSKEEALQFLHVANVSGVNTLIFTTPYKCMPPSEVPEHEVLVDDEYVEWVKGNLDQYILQRFEVVDEQGHAIWVFKRK